MTWADDGWIGDLYDDGHTDPVVCDGETPCEGPFLTVRLPASTRIRLTLRLRLRTPQSRS
ncbi:hypothetical protein ACIP2Y_41770 [Streptomyces sviceus]|uniref:hypothetical protein n=1 Tax=Streptomyces sviceus TaxID=285530 RepID=UPI00381C0D7C